MAGEHHRLEDQILRGEEWSGNGFLLIGTFTQFHLGNIWVNHPSLELPPINLPHNRDLGVADRHSRFYKASGSFEHSFHSVGKVTVAITRPSYGDILVFKKSQILKQSHGVEGSKA